MNTKTAAIIAPMLLAFAGLVSCSHQRPDPAITADVQAKIQQDTALAATSITVQSNSGVVVLSGNVASDVARVTAENDARQIQGVKGVVNNLQVQTAAAATPAAAMAAQSQPTRTKPSPAKPTRRAVTSPAPSPAAVPSAATSPIAVQPETPPSLPPAPVEITIPEGTKLTIRLIDPVDTAKNKEGDTFRASLDVPILIQEKVAIPKNADVTARLVSAKSAGRFAGSSSVVLVLHTISVGGKTYAVQTGEFTKQAASRSGRTAKVVGGGAAVGAVIGAIAGGGKGAAIGAAAGAGAGTGVQALTKGEQIKLPAETLLEFELKAPVTVTPAAEAAQSETAG